MTDQSWTGDPGQVVIVATTLGGETLTSRPMPRLVAEMLLALWVKKGIARVEMRRIP